MRASDDKSAPRRRPAFSSTRRTTSAFLQTSPPDALFLLLAITLSRFVKVPRACRTLATIVVRRLIVDEPYRPQLPRSYNTCTTPDRTDTFQMWNFGIIRRTESMSGLLLFRRVEDVAAMFRYRHTKASSPFCCASCRLSREATFSSLP
jgi:hypothetical protein